MYRTETRTGFIELLANGWSIKRIAARLDRPADCDRQDQDNIRTLRALELEAPREKMIVD